MMKYDNVAETDYEAIREALRRLLQEAGREGSGLLQFVDEAERREAADRERTAQLMAENERLKQEVRKLRVAQAGTMSSRLRDALRE